MSNELLDFTKQDNFEFFEFSEKKNLHPDVQARLKQKCEHVLDIAYTTVQDMCLLGFNLKELKNSRNWEFVKNPRTGELFFNHSFQEFCEYAFGFSKTKTSDLLRIAEFVKVSGTKNNGFIDERYSGYNTSQLVELAPVREEDRKYFNADMPVAEMRKIKDYMKNGLFCVDKHEPDFDLKKKTEEYHERKNKKDEERPNVIPGQIELGEEVFEPEQEEENPISDLATYGEEVETVEDEPKHSHTWTEEELEEFEQSDDPYDMPMQTHNYDSDYSPDEEAKEDEEDPYDMPMQTHSYDGDYSPDEENTEYPSTETNEIPDKVLSYKKGEYDPYDENVTKGMFPGYEPNLKNRDGIREFYRTFRNWEQLHTGIYFIQLYRYKFKSGTLYALSAPQTNILSTTDERTEGETIHYFWQYKGDQRAFETNKLDLEKFIALHKDEL